ncbi:MAG: hypothetical protein RIE73_30620 [Coleofasciculus sp. C1-SOL-03]|jgi:MioC protein|uniref:hypothetical protein n=1 Tax=Coleofasciculus sp. C1-SOL-03 TaxID=3069522 RepID=UPI0032F78C50
MSSNQLATLASTNLPLHQKTLSNLSQQQKRTHHYKVSNERYNHVFVSKDGGIRAYMTEQGQGIEPGDYLVLQRGSTSNRYQVDKINYYANPPDMWIALLKQC